MIDITIRQLCTMIIHLTLIFSLIFTTGHLSFAVPDRPKPAPAPQKPIEFKLVENSETKYPSDLYTIANLTLAFDGLNSSIEFKKWLASDSDGQKAKDKQAAFAQYTKNSVKKIKELRYRLIHLQTSKEQDPFVIAINQRILTEFKKRVLDKINETTVVVKDPSNEKDRANLKKFKKELKEELGKKVPPSSKERVRVSSTKEFETSQAQRGPPPAPIDKHEISPIKTDVDPDLVSFVERKVKLPNGREAIFRFTLDQYDRELGLESKPSKLVKLMEKHPLIGSIVRFPIEGLRFYYTLGAHVVLNSNFENIFLGGAIDPMAMENFFSSLSPIAIFGFFVFLYTSHRTSAFFKNRLAQVSSNYARENAHLTKDIRLALAKADKTTLTQLQSEATNAARWYGIKQKALQMGAASFPLGLGASAQHVVESLYTDITESHEIDSFRYCKAAALKENPTDEDKAHAITACDEAYERWTLPSQIRKLYPSALSLISASIISSNLQTLAGLAFSHAKSAAGKVASKVIPLSLSHVQIELVPGLGSLIPKGKILARVAAKWMPSGSLLIFLVIADMTSPWISERIEASQTKGDLVSYRDSVFNNLNIAIENKWPNFEHKSDSICARLQQRAQDSGTAGFYFWSTLSWAAKNIKSISRNLFCGPIDAPLADELRRFSKTSFANRQHILQKAWQAYQSWGEYANRFIGQYQASYSFYKDLIHMRHDPTTPFYQLPSIDGVGNPVVYYPIKKIQQQETDYFIKAQVPEEQAKALGEQVAQEQGRRLTLLVLVDEIEEEVLKRYKECSGMMCRIFQYATGTRVSDLAEDQKEIEINKLFSKTNLASYGDFEFQRLVEIRNFLIYADDRVPLPQLQTWIDKFKNRAQKLNIANADIDKFVNRELNLVRYQYLAQGLMLVDDTINKLIRDITNRHYFTPVDLDIKYPPKSHINSPTNPDETDDEKAQAQQDSAIAKLLQPSKAEGPSDLVDQITARSTEESALRFLGEDNIFYRIRKALGMPVPLPPGGRFLNLLEDKLTQQEPGAAASHPGSIGFAATPRLTDYLLASAICGPDAESAPNETYSPLITRWLETFEKTGGLPALEDPDLVSKINNLPQSPLVVAKVPYLAWAGDHLGDYIGFSRQFSPPNIIDRSRLGYNPCSTPNFWAGLNSLFQGYFDGVGDFWFNIHRSVFRSAHQAAISPPSQANGHSGFLDIFWEHGRADLMGEVRNDDQPDLPNFNKWWLTQVEPSVFVAIAQMRSQYNEGVLKRYFKPAFVVPGSVQLAVSKARNSYLPDLVQPLDGARDVESSIVTQALMDEAALYLHILRTIYSRFYNLDRNAPQIRAMYDIEERILSGIYNTLSRLDYKPKSKGLFGERAKALYAEFDALIAAWKFPTPSELKEPQSAACMTVLPKVGDPETDPLSLSGVSQGPATGGLTPAPELRTSSAGLREGQACPANGSPIDGTKVPIIDNAEQDSSQINLIEAKAVLFKKQASQYLADSEQPLYLKQTVVAALSFILSTMGEVEGYQHVVEAIPDEEIYADHPKASPQPVGE